ncbi:MAG: Outer membrane chaperone Skp (OmpH) [Rhodospirillaceae bacterium]|nr:MAG: Outer membrane chaperone Skp (OmpH) [Rhodospirillaceae bacterium]
MGKGWVQGVKKILAVVGIVVLAGGGLAFAEGAKTGGEAVSVVVGVVDVPRLVRESAAGKTVLEQRQKYLTVFQNDTRKEEKELSDADRELVRQRTLLLPEAFAEKQGEFRKRLTEFQQTVEQRRRNLDRSVGAALGQIEKKIVELVQAVAKERGVNVVLSQTQVYMFEPRFDMTDPVMERMNKALPKVTMQDPAKLPPPEEQGDAKKP